jgi:hypothetical protein
MLNPAILGLFGAFVSKGPFFWDSFVRYCSNKHRLKIFKEHVHSHFIKISRPSCKQGTQHNTTHQIIFFRILILSMGSLLEGAFPSNSVSAPTAPPTPWVTSST